MTCEICKSILNSNSKFEFRKKGIQNKMENRERVLTILGRPPHFWPATPFSSRGPSCLRAHGQGGYAGYYLVGPGRQTLWVFPSRNPSLPCGPWWSALSPQRTYRAWRDARSSRDLLTRPGHVCIDIGSHDHGFTHSSSFPTLATTTVAERDYRVKQRERESHLAPSP
jgi:hypothetical protein